MSTNTKKKRPRRRQPPNNSSGKGLKQKGTRKPKEQREIVMECPEPDNFEKKLLRRNMRKKKTSPPAAAAKATATAPGLAGGKYFSRNTDNASKASDDSSSGTDSSLPIAKPNKHHGGKAAKFSLPSANDSSSTSTSSSQCGNPPPAKKVNRSASGSSSSSRLSSSDEDDKTKTRAQSDFMKELLISPNKAQAVATNKHRLSRSTLRSGTEIRGSWVPPPPASASNSVSALALSSEPPYPIPQGKPGIKHDPESDGVVGAGDSEEEEKEVISLLDDDDKEEEQQSDKSDKAPLEFGFDRWLVENYNNDDLHVAADTQTSSRDSCHNSDYDLVQPMGDLTLTSKVSQATERMAFMGKIASSYHRAAVSQVDLLLLLKDFPAEVSGGGRKVAALKKAFRTFRQNIAAMTIYIVMNESGASSLKFGPDQKDPSTVQSIQQVIDNSARPKQEILQEIGLFCKHYLFLPVHIELDFLLGVNLASFKSTQKFKKNKGLWSFMDNEWYKKEGLLVTHKDILEELAPGFL